MEIENEYTQEQAIVPTALSEDEAAKIFHRYYSQLKYFQVQVTQMDHFFFEPKLYNIHYDAYEAVEGSKRKRKVRHNFYCLENLVRLKKYGEIYLDKQLKANKQDKNKSAEEREIFSKMFKRYKTRLSNAFDDKIQYLNELDLLQKLEGVNHRNLIKQNEVKRMLNQFKLEDHEKFKNMQTRVNDSFAFLLKEEQNEVNMALKTNSVQTKKSAARAKKAAAAQTAQSNDVSVGV